MFCKALGLMRLVPLPVYGAFLLFSACTPGPDESPEQEPDIPVCVVNGADGEGALVSLEVPTTDEQTYYCNEEVVVTECLQAFDAGCTLESPPTLPYDDYSFVVYLRNLSTTTLSVTTVEEVERTPCAEHLLNVGWGPMSASIGEAIEIYMTFSPSEPDHGCEATFAIITDSPEVGPIYFRLRGVVGTLE